MKLKELIEKLKSKWQKVGYTCDNCDREVFDYPETRLCEDCESALVKNAKSPCEKCGRLSVTGGVCLNCKSVLPAFDQGIAPFAYYGEAAEIINKFKSGKAYLAVTLGEYMVEEVKLISNALDVVAYVPQDEVRKRFRGYDQAELLAKTVAKGLGLPLVKPLVCLGKKEQQKELTIRERMQNVEDIYRVVDKNCIKGKTVVLVDDIMTTGATGSECAARLKKAGAKAVCFLTAAALPERK